MRLESTRKAIHDALAWGYMQQGLSGMGEYLVYLTKIEKSIRNNDPCVDFLEAAYICAAINSLKPGYLGGWLKFSYGPDDLSLVQASIAAQMRFKIFPMCSVKKHNRLISLCNLALEDYRLRFHQRRALPNAMYAEALKVHPENWNRDWEHYQSKCLDEIKQWDAEAVGKVSCMVMALKGENERQPSEVLLEMSA